MRASSTLALGLTFFAALGLAGLSCAEGGKDPGFEQEGGGEGGANEGGGHVRPTSSTTGSGTRPSSGPGAGGSGAGDPGAGGTGAGAGAGDPGCDYSAAESCVSAVPAGVEVGDNGEIGLYGDDDINNDHDKEFIIKHGSTSAFFDVYLFENSSFDRGVSYLASLESPPGMNFQLAVYEGDAENKACGSPPYEPSNNSTGLCWDEDYFGSPGHDDSHWVTFEVRYVSGGLCGVDATWTLTIEGNAAAENDPDCDNF